MSDYKSLNSDYYLNSPDVIYLVAPATPEDDPDLSNPEAVDVSTWDTAPLADRFHAPYRKIGIGTIEEVLSDPRIQAIMQNNMSADEETQFCYYSYQDVKKLLLEVLQIVIPPESEP